MSTQLAYSVEEAATQTGLSAAAIKRAINQRQLKAKASSMRDGKVVGKYLIRHADLVAWVDGLADA